MFSNVLEAKTHLSALLERVERGEDVIIGRHGTPVARLVPIEPPQRRAGDFAGRIRGDITGSLSDDAAPWG